MKHNLLEGIRVMDITFFITGPLTTEALAYLGAEVIKVERQNRLGRGASGSGMTGSMQQSGGKLSITLDFANPKGLELARRLIATADVVVENLAGGALAKRGLSYEEIKKIKPDIIMLSSCMQGQTGPYATHAASGHKLTALSGFNQISGWPDREPGWIGAYTDFIAPRFNIIALLAALDYRKRTGKGQYLDISQNEAGLQFLAPSILDYNVNHRIADRMGNQSPSSIPHNAYRCLGEDRWCAISVSTDEEWHSLCEVIGDPALAQDPRFATLLARKENEQELDSLVNGWTSTRTAEEVMASMQSAGVSAGVVETAEDMLDHDPQLKARRFFSELDYPGLGKYHAAPGTYFRLSKYAPEAKRAPLMGEHNEYVFKQLLGIPDAEYERLVSDGVIS